MFAKVVLSAGGLLSRISNFKFDGPSPLKGHASARRVNYKGEDIRYAPFVGRGRNYKAHYGVPTNFKGEVRR